MLIIAIITIIFSIITIIFERNNYIILLLTLELFLIALTLLFIYCSLILDDFYGILSSIYLLSLGAIESAIGLTILIIYNQTK
jgi:NADH:ubiquinone oxidoreductase subunit K